MGDAWSCFKFTLFLLFLAIHVFYLKLSRSWESEHWRGSQTLAGTLLSQP